MSILRFAAAAAVASAAVTVPAGAALADADADYARAVAFVQHDGTLIRGKDVISSHRASTGQYCVQVGPDINTSNAVVLVTPFSRAVTAAYAGPHPVCGNQPNTVLVSSFSLDSGGMQDISFYLSIP